MISTPCRRKTVMLINKAIEAGSRLKPACRVVGISPRTYQRWTVGKDVESDKRPTANRPEPKNKLSKKADVIDFNVEDIGNKVYIYLEYNGYVSPTDIVKMI